MPPAKTLGVEVWFLFKEEYEDLPFVGLFVIGIWDGVGHRRAGVGLRGVCAHPCYYPVHPVPQLDLPMQLPCHFAPNQPSLVSGIPLSTRLGLAPVGTPLVACSVRSVGQRVVFVAGGVFESH